MKYLYIITFISVLISFFFNKEKTFKSLKIAYKKFFKIAPTFIFMLILVSFGLYFLPDSVISKYLGGNNIFISFITAIIIGSISAMPGFVAFPLCGILVSKGVSYIIVSAFTTTAMMVGVFTFPIEKAYLGNKVTIIRNISSLFIAIIVAIITGIIYGEIL